MDKYTCEECGHHHRNPFDDALERGFIAIVSCLCVHIGVLASFVQYAELNLSEGSTSWIVVGSVILSGVLGMAFGTDHQETPKGH